MLPSLLVLLSACVLDHEDWVERRNRAVCELRVACFDLEDDEDACRTRLGREDELDCDGVPDRAACLAAARRASCPKFDLAAARACIDALERQVDACPARRIDDWQIPATCADVCEPKDE